MRGGVDIVQLRDKSLDDDGIVAAAGAFRGTGALFILNDRPDLVEACGADGVHVGQDDATPAASRAAVGRDRIVGRSTHAPEQARGRGRRPGRRLPRRRPGARDADQARPPGGRAATTSRTRRARSPSRGSRSAASTRATCTRSSSAAPRGSSSCARSPRPTILRPRRARCAVRWRGESVPGAEAPRGYARSRERADAVRRRLAAARPRRAAARHQARRRARPLRRRRQPRRARPPAPAESRPRSASPSRC